MSEWAKLQEVIDGLVELFWREFPLARLAKWIVKRCGRRDDSPEEEIG